MRATILILMLLILPSSLLSYLSHSSEIDPIESLNAHYDSVIHEHEKIIAYLKERNESKLERTILEYIEMFQKRIILYISS